MSLDPPEAGLQTSQFDSTTGPDTGMMCQATCSIVLSSRPSFRSLFCALCLEVGGYVRSVGRVLHSSPLLRAQSPDQCRGACMIIK